MSHRFHISRRTFLSHCTAIAAATGLPRWFVERELSASTQGPAVTASPNDRPGIALVGCGGMGRGDAKNASRFGDIVAVVDVDESHAAMAAKQFTNGAKVPAQFTDFRKMLEQKDVNVVLNGDAGSLAHAHQPRGRVGEERHLRREAADAHRR